MSNDSERFFGIAHVYAIYARAIDEKRFDLLDQVFLPEATLEYTVGEHAFTTSGAGSGAAFGNFLECCYWTNHLIGTPMVETTPGGAFATARVQATHLQHRDDGSSNRWFLRGSYHDHFEQHGGNWLIAARRCICTDEEGEFLAEGVRKYPQIAWADAAAVRA